MKYILWLFLAFSMVLFSCNDKEEIEKDLITVDKGQIVLDGNGDSKVLTINSTAGEWTIVSDSEWCVPNVSSGDTKIGIVKIEAEANLTFERRKAFVTISAPNSDDVSVEIVQGIPSDMDLITVSKEELTVDNQENTLKVTITSNSIQWSGSTPVDWITFTPESGQKGETEMTISVLKNEGVLRRATITLVADGSLNKTIRITQEAADYPSYVNYIDPDITGVEKNAIELAYQMQLGWNLGNTLEVPGNETGWGNPKTTKEIIDIVKNAGFDAVRIPCAWDSYIEDRGTAKIKDSWMNRVKEVVGYCLDNDMNAIINIHWDGGWLENNPVYSKQDEINAKQKALWEQIAMAFRDYDERLLFAGTNEVHYDYGTPTNEHLTVQMSFNQTFVDAVRSTGGKNAYRNLIVQSYNTNIDLAYDKLKMPKDQVTGRLMAEVHYYDPWDFAGADSKDNAKFYWGKEAGTTSGISSYGQEDHVRNQFKKMKTKFVDKGIPVIMGEYGAVNRTGYLNTEEEKTKHQESRKYFLKYTTKIMRENGIVPFYWDNGYTGTDGFGLFNRSAKTIVDQNAIDGMIEGRDESEYPK